MSRLADLGYAAGWRFVRALPEPAARLLFDQAADAAWRRNGGGTAQLARNLRRVVGPDMSEPELSALARQGMRRYARYWMEAFRLPSMSRQRIVDTFHLPQQQIIADAVAAGTGLVLALPHMGNWDHAGAWAAANGWPLSTVAERLKPESLFKRFVAYRESLGMEILPLTGGAAPPLDVLTDRLRAGHLVPLLADRDLSARGVRVEFFGEPARMPAGPAMLALRAGAPLCTVSLWHGPGRTCGWLDPVSTAASGSTADRIGVITQRVADAMARRIAEHPADWHMLQRLWLADLPHARAAAAAARGDRARPGVPRGEE
ncbi:MAG: phosphatidylinositol mannoside acyltransferase [Micromonosporaceae bacterium]|nr:phosphatidylinositol mannoside acyltransferase [Micromonosporaceae bacterium]